MVKTSQPLRDAIKSKILSGIAILVWLLGVHVQQLVFSMVHLRLVVPNVVHEALLGWVTLKISNLGWVVEEEQITRVSY